MSDVVSCLQVYKDSRTYGYPRYAIRNTPFPTMAVPNRFRKCVFFIGFKDDIGDFRLGGTAFVVSVPGDRKDRHYYVVTARHNLEEIRKHPENPDKDKILLRVNRIYDDPAMPIETLFDDWHQNSDPSIDVAAIPWRESRAEFEFSHIPSESRFTRQLMEESEIDVGDEAFITGLFVAHHGKHRNSPIVRMGSIAMIPEENETVYTDALGDAHVYLLEVRSIGGLSGSPVWVHLPVGRSGAIHYGEEAKTIWLGLVHGHWETSSMVLDSVSPDTISTEKMNMGIAIVVPAESVYETLQHEDLIAQREADEADLPKETTVVADVSASATVAPPAMEDNPDHREDFNRLLDAAVPGNKSDR